MGKQRFKLTGSTFVQNDGSGQTTYKRGDVIESNEDLTQKFLNMFEKVSDKKAPEVTKKSKTAKGKREGEVSSDGEDDGEEVAHPLRPSAEVDDNEVDASNMDYDKNKKKAKEAEEADEPEEEDEDAEEDEEEAEGDKEFGNDVTMEYKKAKSADLKVFFDSKKKQFTVVDADEPSSPIHKEKLKDKKAVNGFINTYLKTN